MSKNFLILGALLAIMVIFSSCASTQNLTLIKPTNPPTPTISQSINHKTINGADSIPKPFLLLKKIFELPQKIYDRILRRYKPKEPAIKSRVLFYFSAEVLTFFLKYGKMEHR